jgi:homoserine kinase type II
MSVFTPLARPELETFLAPYGLGRLLDFQGIAAGSENTNFFISLEQGEFVLTLVERGPVQEMPFFIELLDVLHEADLPVPYALRTTDGIALRELAGKPALLQPRLAGKHIKVANAQHCAQVGELLGHLHLATQANMIKRKTDRGLDWMLEEGTQLLSHLNAEQSDLLQRALDEITQQKPMLYDVAIALNDWCSDDDGLIDGPRARALLGAYAALRPFTAAEAELWPTMLRVACVRFWLSRLIAAECCSQYWRTTQALWERGLPAIGATRFSGLQRLQAPRQIIPQLLQHVLVPLSSRRRIPAQRIQLRQFHRQTCHQRFRQARPQRWFAEYTGLAHFLQTGAHRRDVLGTRLHFGGDAEHTSVLEAVSVFEVVERFMEHKVRFACDTRQPRLQAQVQRVETVIKCFEIALIARRVVRIDRAQVRGHFRCDHPSVDRR